MAVIGKFIPHTAKSAVFVEFKEPQILITPEAHDKMYYWVQKCSKEIGWFGIVDRKDNNIFVLEDVILFKQDVTLVQTEIDESGLADFYTKTMDENKDDPEKAVEILKKFRLWGHSHVNMGTTGSATDDAQIEIFRPKGEDTMDIEWFIRLIANKSGRMEFNIYFFKENILVEDVTWHLINSVEDEVIKVWEAELKELVSDVPKHTLPSVTKKANPNPNTPQGNWEDGWGDEYNGFGYGFY